MQVDLLCLDWTPVLRTFPLHFRVCYFWLRGSFAGLCQSVVLEAWMHLCKIIFWKSWWSWWRGFWLGTNPRPVINPCRDALSASECPLRIMITTWFGYYGHDMEKCSHLLCSLRSGGWGLCGFAIMGFISIHISAYISQIGSVASASFWQDAHR